MRTKLADRHLPNYSIGEERFHMISHIVGAALGIVALVCCVVVSALHSNTYGVVSSVIYGCSMILLYTTSSVYHGLPKNLAKKVFQALDHCAIYLLIAGTYSPVTLSAFRRVDVTAAWIIFGIVWALAALAITLTAIDVKQYRVFSMICYIGMGWGCIAVYPLAIAALGVHGFILLLTGGICYTVGAILYAVGKRKKYFHGVFHVCCFLGSLIHFLCIVLYAL